MKAIKVKALIHETNEAKEAVLPEMNDVLRSAQLSVSMASALFGREITLTKLNQAYDATSVELEYKFADTGEVYMTLQGEEVEVDRIPAPELPEPILKILAQMEKEMLAEELGPHAIN